jgi:hypothetical protein
MELPEGYGLEEVGNGVRVLKRPNGYVLAAFGSGVKPKNIQNVAKADERYLKAKELNDKFGLGGDPESVFMFASDVKKAREEYLLALEVAYRE